jgi:hypothetical protein
VNRLTTADLAQVEGANALAHRVTLVMHNMSEFNRAPGLILEDWQ